MTVHVVNLYPTRDPEVLRRRSVALESWIENLWSRGVEPVIEAGEAIPFVADMIDFGFRRNPDGLILTNADTCVLPDALPTIREALDAYGCYYSRRVDLPRIDAPLDSRLPLRWPPYAGADLFAMTRQWWVNTSPRWPDLYFAREGWDFVMKAKMQESGFRPNGTIIYHEKHEAAWKQNITTDPFQIHNRQECERWAKASGYGRYLYTQPPYLFALEVGELS